MKLYITAVALLLSVGFALAQTSTPTPINNYLKEAGDYATIYSGELEAPYNPAFYTNLPYYTSDEFVPGELVYNGTKYPGQLMRLDLHKEILVLLTPEKKINVIVDHAQTDSASLWGKTIVWFAPDEGSNMPTGYYFRLYEGNKMQLMQKNTFILRQQKNRGERRRPFDLRVRYYLFYNGTYHQVKNKSSFTKMFPQLKREINQYVKDYSLDFKKQPDKSLTLLTVFVGNNLFKKE